MYKLIDAGTGRTLPVSADTLPKAFILGDAWARRTGGDYRVVCRCGRTVPRSATRRCGAH